MKPSLAFLLLALAGAQALSQTGVTAIRCGTFIDGVSDVPRRGVVIVVEGNTIREVGKDVPAGAALIDLSAATVMPGLIDAHTHILLQGDITEEDYAEQILKESIPYRTLRASLSCRIALMNGFTTLRDQRGSVLD